MKNEEVRGILGENVSGLKESLNMFSHITKMLSMFDCEDFPMCVGYVDHTGNWKWVNTTFAKELGHTKEYIYSRPWKEFIVDDNREEVVSEYQKRNNDQTPFKRYPVKHLRSDGTTLELIWDTSEVSDEMTFCVSMKPLTY